MSIFSSCTRRQFGMRFPHLQTEGFITSSLSLPLIHPGEFRFNKSVMAATKKTVIELHKHNKMSLQSALIISID